VTVKLTEASAAIGILVLHDHAVGDLAKLLEVSTEPLVSGGVVQTADEDLPQDFPLGSGGGVAFLVLGRGLLDLDLGDVDDVGLGIVAGLGLVFVGVSDETESTENEKKILFSSPDSFLETAMVLSGRII